jgi:Nucleotide modification associated domain 1
MGMLYDHRDCEGTNCFCQERYEAAERHWEPEDFEGALAETFAEAHLLLLKKHRDYGPNNIALSPGGPINGLRVRLHDKLARINNLVDSDADPENESLRDSFLDMANYAIIGLMVLDGHWHANE